MNDSYEVELARVCEMLGTVHPVGKVKAIGLLEASAALRDMVEELVRLRSVVVQHDLCHDLHGKVDARAFADGCIAEQRRIYGCSPDADLVADLARALQPFADEAKRRPWITNLSDKSGLDYVNIGGSLLTNGDLRLAHDVLAKVGREMP